MKKCGSEAIFSQDLVQMLSGFLGLRNLIEYAMLKLCDLFLQPKREEYAGNQQKEEKEAEPGPKRRRPAFGRECRWAET